MEMGPIRTALFVPGSREDRFQKALNTGADKVIIDLEDAVPVTGKEAAREDVARFLQAHPDPRIIVRVNSVSTPYFQPDLEAIVKAAPVNLMVPKVESPQDLITVNEDLLKIESDTSLDRGSVSIIALIETAKAVDSISEIVKTRTDPHRLHTIAFGAADYSADIGIEMTIEGTELIYPRSRLAVACRAGELEPPIDTPFMVDLKDLNALQRDRAAIDLASNIPAGQSNDALGLVQGEAPVRTVCIDDGDRYWILYVRGTPPRVRYVFKHALIQEAAYGSLPS